MACKVTDLVCIIVAYCCVNFFGTLMAFVCAVTININMTRSIMTTKQSSPTIYVSVCESKSSSGLRLANEA